jgi:hypothetical protein
VVPTAVVLTEEGDHNPVMGILLVEEVGRAGGFEYWQ